MAECVDVGRLRGGRALPDAPETGEHALVPERLVNAYVVRLERAVDPPAKVSRNRPLHRTPAEEPRQPSAEPGHQTSIS